MSAALRFIATAASFYHDELNKQTRLRLSLPPFDIGETCPHRFYTFLMNTCNSSVSTPVFAFKIHGPLAGLTLPLKNTADNKGNLTPEFGAMPKRQGNRGAIIVMESDGIKFPCPQKCTAPQNLANVPLFKGTFFSREYI